MTELNGCEPRKVTVKGPYTFAIGDTSNLGEYKSGGIFTQVKMPKILQFVRVEQLVGPGNVINVPTAEIAPSIAEGT